MTFTSIEYLIFYPIVFLFYWILGKNRTSQNIFIIIASLIFYSWWDWRFMGLLLITILTTFYGGALIQKNKINKEKQKLILACVIVINLGILFYFKYYNFFIQTFIDTFRLFGKNLSISTLSIILPVGISFYTFTALSYTIDIYQKKIEATTDLLAYCAYTMFFPAILSGPISRATKQLPQYFQKREFCYEKAIDAIKLILIGAIMKLCLADRLGIYVNTVYAHIPQHNGTTLLFASILYTIQIYADFAGYSMIAIGSGKLLGIELQTNFIRPYFSKTVTEFWRKWHISLTGWLRDYIYFPLGGSRVSKSRWMLNTMIVFVVSGLWHGASYTFLIWGGLHGICMILERLIYGKAIKEISDKLNVTNILRMILTFSIVSFAWIFFRAETLNDSIEIIRKIFQSHGSLFIDPNTLLLALLAFIIVFTYDLIQEQKLKCIRLFSSKFIIVRFATVAILICYIIGFGVLNSGSFIYFQF